MLKNMQLIMDLYIQKFKLTDIMVNYKIIK